MLCPCCALSKTCVCRVHSFQLIISENERCDPEPDLIVYLTSIISWFKLQAAQKSLKTDEINN